MQSTRYTPFPAYTSGHSTFGGAAAAVLSELFGDRVTFTSEADRHSGLSQRPLSDSLVTKRTFASFEQAAMEAGLSRIYGGIHYSFDNDVGLEAGRSIGRYVVEQWPRKLHFLNSSNRQMSIVKVQVL